MKPGQLVFYATGPAIAAALAIVMSGRYGPAAWALAGLAALAWSLGWGTACRRDSGRGPRRADKTAVIWSA